MDLNLASHSVTNIQKKTYNWESKCSKHLFPSSEQHHATFDRPEHVTFTEIGASRDRNNVHFNCNTTKKLKSLSVHKREPWSS